MKAGQQTHNAKPNNNDGFMPLLLGVKRFVHRFRDKLAAKADAAFRAVRKPALEKANYRCVHCGFRSKETNQVHHIDDDHTNNHPDNLACNCQLCHPYHHIGEAALAQNLAASGEGHLGPKAAQLFRVPDPEAIPARDVNNLLRALALAMNDKNEAQTARRIFALFANAATREDMKTHYASFRAGDMATGMSLLTDDEYAKRAPAIEALRVLYDPRLLVQWGRLWAKEQPALSVVGDWEKIMSGTLKKITDSTAAAPENEDGVQADEVLAAVTATLPEDSTEHHPAAAVIANEDGDPDEDDED